MYDKILVTLDATPTDRAIIEHVKALARIMNSRVVLLHVAGWTLLIVASSERYGVGSGKVLGVGTGILAYSLGMRHAFDADHIAAIDNTTR